MSKAEFKDRLKEAMDFNNMKQIDLASRYGLDKGQISAWLSGRYKPRQKTTDKLARILNVSEAWLMGFDVSPERKASNDAEHFGAYAAAHNKKRREKIISMNLNDSELGIIEKYRSLDDHGTEIIDSVLQIEYERCKSDNQVNVITFTADELKTLPLAKRIELEKYLSGDSELVARKRKS